MLNRLKDSSSALAVALDSTSKPSMRRFYRGVLNANSPPATTSNTSFDGFRSPGSLLHCDRYVDKFYMNKPKKNQMESNDE